MSEKKPHDIEKILEHPQSANVKKLLVVNRCSFDRTSKNFIVNNFWAKKKSTHCNWIYYRIVEGTDARLTSEETIAPMEKGGGGQ